MTSPFSRPARPGFDQQNVNFVVEHRSSEEIGPGCLGRSPHRPVAVICVQEGSGFVTDSSLQENFYVVTRHHSAVLLNEDTFQVRHLLYIDAERVFEKKCVPRVGKFKKKRRTQTQQKAARWQRASSLHEVKQEVRKNARTSQDCTP